MAAPAQVFTIYTLAEDVLKLQAILLDNEIDEETVKQSIEAFLESAGEPKIEQYCKLVKSFEREAKAIADERKDLEAKQRARENAAERMKERLRMLMEASGLEKLPAGIFTCAMQASPASVEVDDVAALPKDLVVVTETADKRAIKERIEAGQEVPGCRLKQSKHLRIR